MNKMKSWIVLMMVTVVMAIPVSNAGAQDWGRFGGHGHQAGGWSGNPAGHPGTDLDRHWGNGPRGSWHGGPRGSWNQGYSPHRDRGRCWNCGAGPAIIGLAVGAILGSAMANSAANSAPRSWSAPRGCRAIVVQGETYYNCGERDDNDDYDNRYRYRGYIERDRSGYYNGWESR